MANSEQRNLYTADYIVGQMPEIDTKAIAKMVLKNHAERKMMHPDPNNIRGEDVRIDFDKNIERISKELIKQYDFASNGTRQIALCCDTPDPRFHKDKNESYWAIVHERGDTTVLHSHENPKKYEVGPHISAAFWIQVPENSGDFVFQYKPNPYMVSETTLKSTEGCFLMFDSTLKHRVTENLSGGQRIVVSMNFNII